MDAIKAAFDAYFSTWGITLPDADLAARRRGELSAAGWRIRYLFGSDERGPYLDFYATHRMTNDRHERFYASGESITLPAYLDFMVFPPDATPEQRRAVEAAYLAHNREVGALLKEKGFG